MAKRDLRSMKKGTGDSRIKREDIKEAAKKVNMNADVDQIDNGDIKSVEDTISQYENKSEDELMNDLESMVRKGKQDGTFSDDMLDAFIKNVAPMMDKDQRQRLDALARMIKMNKI